MSVESSGQSTPTLTGAEKNKAIKLLVERVKAGEDALKAKESRVTALAEQVAEMERSKQNLSEAYKQSLLELGELKGEVKNLRSAVAELKVNLGEAKAERDTAQAEVKGLKKENRLLKLALTLGAVAVVSILR